MSGTVKHGIMLLLVGAILLGSFAAAFATDPLQPKIYIQKMRHDFGKIFEQEKYEDAVANLESYLRLNPGDTNAQGILEQLRIVVEADSAGGTP